MPLERWTPSKTITRQEEYLLKRCLKKRKLFAFLREHRDQLFDEAFQEDLESMYRGTGAGKEPLCPALMAMALILQGYLGVSDADAVELSAVDLRWQMVLDRLGEEEPAFSQGALFHFRERLIEHEMDRRLLERTAELARATKGFDAKKLPKTLKIAIDSSPLQGAGRVEDTINLIGHAARKVAKTAAKLLKCEYDAFCKKAGIPLLAATSIKKALDRDWSDPEQKAEAVDVVARQVLAMERWISKNIVEEAEKASLKDLIAVMYELMDQDLDLDPDHVRLRIAQEVTEDRRISIEDPDMRHGRKSKSKRIDGYKRHVAMDLKSTAIVACSVTPANRPEHEAFPALKADIDAQGIRFAEAHLDRGYMGSPTVAELAAEGSEILCKPWKNRNGDLFSKDDFSLNLRARTITCPAGHTEAFELGKTVAFDPAACDPCSLRRKCTTARKGHGRSVSIQQDEALQKRLRTMSKSPRGRERFRERVAVEHSLAHIGQRQGNRSRYLGTRKNLFDVRRAAAIQNLEITQRRAA